ncbi:uncharacterized protein LOC106093983 [Stomoxys calcitrans]|uniref:Uncharacterized protein n=1 Tax=Stomoxys calcitrans TaxID=35570 RepID=A0A1I8PSS0_STOCA|nr:uncharacterized protein LOC106093983 [Stomoxys calcitrans]
MNLKVLHIHGLIVASLSMLTSLTTILAMAALVIPHQPAEILENVAYAAIGLAVGSFIAGGLMIYGIIKKSPLFLLPWLTICTAASFLLFIAVFAWFVHVTAGHYVAFFCFLNFTGILIMILYPIYGLFFEMRAQKFENLQLI